MKEGENKIFMFSLLIVVSSFTDDTTKYKLIINCGGCMLNRAAMLSMIDSAIKHDILPFAVTLKIIKLFTLKWSIFYFYLEKFLEIIIVKLKTPW